MNRTALHTLTNIHICPPTDENIFCHHKLLLRSWRKKETKKKMCMSKKNLVMRTRTIDDLSNRPLNWFYHHKKGGRSCRLKIPLYIVSLTVQHEHMIMANVTRIFYAWFRGTDLSIITKELFLKDRISAQCFLIFFFCSKSSYS